MVAVSPGVTQAELDAHATAADPHPGYRLESAPIQVADLAFDPATQAELDAEAAARAAADASEAVQYGYLAWTYDPAAAEAQDSVASVKFFVLAELGVLWLYRLALNGEHTISGVDLALYRQDDTVTSALFGVYTFDGTTATLRASTANEAGEFTGEDKLIATDFTAPYDYDGTSGVLVALLFNGGTPPYLWRRNVIHSDALEQIVLPKPLRAGKYGSGLAALPATFPIGDMTHHQFRPWLAIR